MTRASWPVRFVKTPSNSDLAVLVKQGGEAPPFLVVNPLGTPARFSSELVPAVADFCDAFLRQNACFEFEWRGTGLSGPAPDPLEMADLVVDIAAAAGAIGGPYHMLAFGAGAVPALQFASSAGSHLLSVVLDTPCPGFDLGELAVCDDDKYESALATRLRVSFDFPPDVVARELVPAYSRDVPRPLLHAWVAAWDEFAASAKPLPQVTVPLLIYTEPGRADDAAGLASTLPQARTVVGRGMAINAMRANELRNQFDVFWAEVSGDAQPTLATNGLSPRELEVLRLLATGKTNAQIAGALTLSHATVATHVRHILEKTGSSNRSEATAYAIHNGLA